MNEPSEPVSASEWLVALTDNPQDSDLKARFEIWHALCSENARAWEETTRMYALLGRTRDAGLTDALPLGRSAGQSSEKAGGRSERSRGGRSPRRRTVRAGRLGLAAAALAACAAVFFLALDPIGPAGDYTTRTAEIGTFTLPDGSTLKLAPKGAVALLPEGQGRGIRLLEGTAYLDVNHDPDNPFRVVTEDLEVTVLGTRFEVRSWETLSEVAVREGAVAVTERSGSGHSGSGQSGAGRHDTILKTGDWLRIAGAGARLEHGKIPPEQVADWLSGKIIARDRPVGEVVDELRTYYTGVVVLQGDALAAQPLTGVFNLANPQAALRAVASSQGAKAYSLTPWMTVMIAD